jgi:hypothetical protein
MQRRLLLAAAVASALLLAGCSSAPTPTAAGTPTAAPAAVELSPTPTPTPTGRGELVVAAHGLEYTSGGGTRRAVFDNGADVVALLSDAAHITPPTGKPHTDIQTTEFDFDGATVIVPDAGRTWMLIDAGTINGIPVHTSEGITVGSTRTQLKAAGAEDSWDENNDGVADYLALEFVDVPGTQSLVHEGSTGRDYLEMHLRGDVVVGMQAPANDYSDY